jgi:hypothetical protein
MDILMNGLIIVCYYYNFLRNKIYLLFYEVINRVNLNGFNGGWIGWWFEGERSSLVVVVGLRGI